MSKGLIAFIAVAFIAVVAAMVIYMKQSADKARKISSLNKMYYDSLRNAVK